MVANRTQGFGGGGGDDPEDDPNRINKILEQAKRRGRCSPGVAPEPPWKKQKKETQAAIASCLRPGEDALELENMQREMEIGLQRVLMSQGRRGFAFPPLQPWMGVDELVVDLLRRVGPVNRTAEEEEEVAAPGGKGKGKGKGPTRLIPGCTPQSLPKPPQGPQPLFQVSENETEEAAPGKGKGKGKGRNTQQTTRNNPAGGDPPRGYWITDYMTTGRSFFF